MCKVSDAQKGFMLILHGTLDECQKNEIHRLGLYFNLSV